MYVYVSIITQQCQSRFRDVPITARSCALIIVTTAAVTMTTRWNLSCNSDLCQKQPSCKKGEAKNTCTLFRSGVTCDHEAMYVDELMLPRVYTPPLLYF